jgi:cellulose synthase/poly-beta-1,6-N-acetylglucosamine synthase-like glycosyltransferase
MIFFLILIIFLVSFCILFYIYLGYPYLLKLLVWLRRITEKGNKFPPCERFFPEVTIYFSAYNEEINISERIENIFSMDYPSDKIEVIVVSDGSTDGTVSLVNDAIKKNPSKAISLINFKKNRGQAEAQNAVAKAAKYNILLSTDAETRFSIKLLKELVKPFSDPKVGVVGGKVKYLTGGSSIGESYSLYRNSETEMRRCETELGIGFQVDGPCTAYRKQIWEPIKTYEDVDQVISLFARKKGFFTVQAENAICFDKANSNSKKEMIQRARMTRKGLLSKLGRWDLVDVLKHPFFSFALFSHKLLRYFTPIFLILLIFSGIILSFLVNFGIEISITIILILILLAVGNFFKIKLLRKVYLFLESFFYANIGFGMGIVEWVIGKKDGGYKPTRQI